LNIFVDNELFNHVDKCFRQASVVEQPIQTETHNFSTERLEQQLQRIL